MPGPIPPMASLSCSPEENLEEDEVASEKRGLKNVWGRTSDMNLSSSGSVVGVVE